MEAMPHFCIDDRKRPTPLRRQFTQTQAGLGSLIPSRRAFTSSKNECMHSAEDWQSVEGTLTQDMATLSSYLKKWKLKLSTTKTVTAAFHLYNKETTRELKFAAEGRILPFSAGPTYLGVKLDRSLTYCRHLESLRKKLTTRVGLLRRLAGSSWGAGAKTLRTASLALIHSAAECCAPVWSRSAHTRLIDKLINDALRLVTGCLRPTPTDDLFVLSGITPSELRRKRATLSLACRAREPHCLWLVVPGNIYSTISSCSTLMECIDSSSQDTPLCLLLWNYSEMQANWAPVQQDGRTTGGALGGGGHFSSAFNEH